MTGRDSLWVMDSEWGYEEELTMGFEAFPTFHGSPGGKKISFSSNYNVYMPKIAPDVADA